MSEGALDYKQALPLLEGVKAKAVLADKSYDTDYIVDAEKAMGEEVVISTQTIAKILGILTNTFIRSVI